ncbi:Hydrolase [Streptomyces griseus]|uniref:Hydrolase n=2 Tax=Streptomyces TaxID=1883 RepID=A0A380PB07_STRGR|nr:Hydrolase [Streptomyces griseus]
MPGWRVPGAYLRIVGIMALPSAHPSPPPGAAPPLDQPQAGPTPAAALPLAPPHAGAGLAPARARPGPVSGQVFPSEPRGLGGRRRTYALVATDLDGTLLRAGDQVSARTRAALELARGAGARHIVVTGRPVPGVRGLLARLGYDGIAVCGQGAQVYDAAGGRMLSALTLDRETAATALGKIEAETGALFAAVDQDGTDGHTLIEPGYRMAHPTLPARPVPHRDSLWERPIAKVLIRHPELTDDELAAAARSVVDGLATVTMAGPGTVELQPLGVTKATGLARAAAQLGLGPADTLAFGDMPNDVPMLRWAAHGVAMANSHAELLAVADEITVSNEEDGVARVLERLYG